MDFYLLQKYGQNIGKNNFLIMLNNLQSKQS